MKKLNSIKLTQLNEQELSNREMNHLLGGAPGDCCLCGCQGPSSTDDNMKANNLNGYSSGGGILTGNFA